MSYREEDGQVILTMSREDYAVLLMRLGVAAAWALKCSHEDFERDLEFVTRLNEGNPHYTPYTFPEKSA